MPARKRNRRQPEHPDPVVRFNRALKEQAARDRTEQMRIQADREEEKRQARLAAEHAARLAAAHQRLDRAIDGVKAARNSGRGRDEAESEYRAAKADVIELESGDRPSWAPDIGES